MNRSTVLKCTFTTFFIAALLVGGISTAHAIGFNISWTGANNYTMTGMFGYDDSLINTGAIDETQLDFFMIEGFLNGGSIGTWDLADGVTTSFPFNFNFDTNTEAFLVSGGGTSNTGQLWNLDGNPGLGFIINGPGNNQGFSLDGLIIANSFLPTSPSNLSATRKASAPIPEPSTMLLLGTGLAGIIAWRRKHPA